MCVPAMSARELIRELGGTTCRCGSRKQSRQTFCRRCYYKLPPPMRQALYNRVGNGYEHAYEQAEEYLAGEGIARFEVLA